MDILGSRTVKLANVNGKSLIVLMDNSFKKTNVLLVNQIVLYVIILTNLTAMSVMILLTNGMVMPVFLLVLLVLNAWITAIFVLLLVSVINVLMDISGKIKVSSANKLFV
jgi:hypothetical protein